MAMLAQVVPAALLAARPVARPCALHAYLTRISRLAPVMLRYNQREV